MLRSVCKTITLFYLESCFYFWFQEIAKMRTARRLWTSLWLCIVWEPWWRWRSDCSGETFHTARFLTQKLLSHVTKLFPFHILQNYISEIVKRLCACGETTCCHKFVPRHRGELFIEIGDPLYVESEQDHLWRKGKWKVIKFSFKLSNKLHNG